MSCTQHHSVKETLRIKEVRRVQKGWPGWHLRISSWGRKRREKAGGRERPSSHTHGFLEALSEVAWEIGHGVYICLYEQTSQVEGTGPTTGTGLGVTRLMWGVMAGVPCGLAPSRPLPAVWGLWMLRGHLRGALISQFPVGALLPQGGFSSDLGK